MGCERQKQQYLRGVDVMVKPADTDSGLVQATKQLGAAMDAYRKAAEVEAVASAQLTTALNELNDCQKRVDNAITDMRKDAPEQSFWSLPTGWESGKPPTRP